MGLPPLLRKGALLPCFDLVGRSLVEPKVVSTKGTVSRLPGGRNCSAAMTGESPVREVDRRPGRATASVP